MGFRIISFCAACAFVTFFASAAIADTISLGFESLAHSGTVSHTASPYDEAGFRLTSNLASNPPGSEFGITGTASARYGGSTAMFLDFSDYGTTQLTSITGISFDLLSIDLATLNTPTYGGRPTDVAEVVTFTGTLSNGGTVTQTFTISNLDFVFHTFGFGSSFSGLSQVSWSQSYPYHQFDNIVVSGSGITSPSPVPLPPAAWTGLSVLVGLAGMAYFRRRAEGQANAAHGVA